MANEATSQNHGDYRIALYYCYIPIPNAEEHTDFHRNLCLELELQGRIRVSSEGINGVLSGLHDNLRDYERRVVQEMKEYQDPSLWELDVKYCQLRSDLPVEAQLFDGLSVKQTTQVVSLLEMDTSTDESKIKGYSNSRRHRRKKERQNPDILLAQELYRRSLKTQAPSAQHLSPSEWNTQLQQLSDRPDQSVILLDCRNVYESDVGHFTSPNAQTVLTNTRKYSELPQVMLQEKDRLASSSHIFMYCTGGVRCERASAFLQTMLDDNMRDTNNKPQIYQLHGGVQRYLEEASTSGGAFSSYYHGKNFVFDPRRYDPLQSNEIVGECLVCHGPHDDYDNGRAPCDNKEARCWNCRILILVCNQCRTKVSCWGEQESSKPRMYCGGLEQACLHMPPVKVLTGSTSSKT